MTGCEPAMTAPSRPALHRRLGASSTREPTSVPPLSCAAHSGPNLKRQLPLATCRSGGWHCGDGKASRRTAWRIRPCITRRLLQRPQGRQARFGWGPRGSSLVVWVDLLTAAGGWASRGCGRSSVRLVAGVLLGVSSDEEGEGLCQICLWSTSTAVYPRYHAACLLGHVMIRGDSRG